MYNGEGSLSPSPKPEVVALLAKLLGHPDEATLMTDLTLQVALVAAADKYQMPDTLMEACKSVYLQSAHLIRVALTHDLVFDFIASLKIIYRSPPAAGLRGRALLMAQSGLAELQHSAEFLEFLLATPEFATDVATKAIQHGFWCSCCQMYVLLPKTVMY
jgi:hypothetical protein